MTKTDDLIERTFRVEFCVPAGNVHFFAERLRALLQSLYDNGEMAGTFEIVRIQDIDGEIVGVSTLNQSDKAAGYVTVGSDVDEDLAGVPATILGVEGYSATLSFIGGSAIVVPVWKICQCPGAPDTGIPCPCPPPLTRSQTPSPSPSPNRRSGTT